MLEQQRVKDAKKTDQQADDGAAYTQPDADDENPKNDSFTVCLALLVHDLRF